MNSHTNDRSPWRNRANSQKHTACPGGAAATWESEQMTASEEAESERQTVPTKQGPGPGGVSGESYQTFTGADSDPDTRPEPNEGTRPHPHARQPSQTAKADKDAPRKENHRPKPLVNTDAKSSTNISKRTQR